MLAHPAHLVLTSFQIVEHLGVIVKLGIHGQRLHRHTYGMQETLVATAIIDRREQRLLFVVVSGQQETVGCREEIALEDAIVLAELIYPSHVDAERPHHRGLAVHGLIQVGHQWRITVAAIEVLGIPLLAFLKG